MRRVVLRRKTMKNNGWINIKDKIPDCDLFYIVYDGLYGEMECLVRMDRYITSDGKWKTGHCGFTYWRPFLEILEEEYEE